MRGIKGYSVYLPRHRLNREAIATAQKGKLPKGYKSVANYDEDALSMGVNAALPLMNETNRGQMSELYFNSTAKLYEDKLSAAIAATTLSLPRETNTIDITNTYRGMSQSLYQGMKASSNNKNNALIIATNKQVGRVKSTIETYSGDGACAFQLSSSDDVIAKIIASETIFDDAQTYWGSSTDGLSRQWEDRFIQPAALQLVDAGMKKILEKNNLQLDEVAHIVFSAPAPRLQATFYKKIRRQMPGQKLLENAGTFGAANGGMMLAACLEDAKRAEWILFIEYGDGCQLTLLETTPALEKYTSPSSVQGQLTRGVEGVTYLDYLRWNGLVPFDEGRRPNTVRMSVPAMKRNERQRLTLEGSQCQSCGTPFYPKQRVCAKCHTKDEMTSYSFLSKKAKLVTYAVDYLASSPAPPTMIGVIDFAGGGRMMVELSDCQPQDVEIGKEVTFSFRHLHENDGIHTYYWKAILKEEMSDE